MDRKIEILAPAGSYEGMLAAMNAGCDAVYIGGAMFGARAYANNLDEDNLRRAIDEAHIRGKKLYLTVNTLLKEGELSEQLYQYLKPLYEEGLDAVIVQDIGAMNFIHRNFKDLEIHASTQTTLVMAEGLSLLQDLNITRMVTAREMSLEEIALLRSRTDLEIETFVHGALCYCYSGQCLMSSMIGGRSGNRGRCAQSCRMPYQVNHKTSYLLSPKDMCTVDMIPEMVEAGIDSFKIEGRMKRPEYAAETAYVYRKYTDRYLELGREGYERFQKDHDAEWKQDMMDLQDIYNRGGFSSGYFKCHNGKNMMTFGRPNHSGVFVGTVTETKKGSVEISLEETVYPQDVLEIRDGEESVYEFTVKEETKKGTKLTARIGSYVVKGKDNKAKVINHKNVNKGCKVYRMKKEQLLKSLAKRFLDVNEKVSIKSKLVARVGEPLQLTYTLQGFEATVTKQIVEPAKNQPMTEERLKEQIGKLNDTYFVLSDAVVDTCHNAFVPVGILNELRRECIKQLEEAIISSYHRTAKEQITLEMVKESKTQMNHENSGTDDVESGEKTEIVTETLKEPNLVVTVSDMEQLQVVLTSQRVSAVYLDMTTFLQDELEESIRLCKEAEKKVFLMLPHICRNETYQRLKPYILSLKENNTHEYDTGEGNVRKTLIQGYVIKNFEEYALIQEVYGAELNKLDLILNHNVYVFNEEAQEFFKQKGLEHVTAPLELTYQELTKLNWTKSDIMVYGYLPVMISAQCVLKNTANCRKSEQKSFVVTFEDRMKKTFTARTNCVDCYNTIYHSDIYSLFSQAEDILRLQPNNLRLDFTLEDAKKVKEVLQMCEAVFYERDSYRFDKENDTTGHFRRGVE